MSLAAFVLTRANMHTEHFPNVVEALMLNLEQASLAGIMDPIFTWHDILHRFPFEALTGDVIHECKWVTV